MVFTPQRTERNPQEMPTQIAVPGDSHGSWFVAAIPQQ
jgi:hypothetical protein